MSHFMNVCILRQATPNLLGVIVVLESRITYKYLDFYMLISEVFNLAPPG